MQQQNGNWNAEFELDLSDKRTHVLFDNEFIFHCAKVASG